MHFFYKLLCVPETKTSIEMRNLIGLLLLLFGQMTLFSQHSVDPTLFQELRYRNIGPTRGGRVTAVAGITSQPSVFYMGATGGGVWKTKNYGQTWDNVSDGFFASPSIGAIRVYQKNPDIVYVGTGSDGMRSNVIIGKGIYKSVDAGATWLFTGLKDAGLIGAVEIHPDNPDIVFVAAIGNPFGPNEERGIFRSTDGGKNWEKVLFISDKTGFSDLEFAPGNPSVIYAAAWTGERKPWTIISGSEEGGIFRSTDMGETWTKLGGGLPGGIIGKGDLAVTPAAPDLLYVLLEAAGDNDGLYISTDKGDSFSLVSRQRGLLDRPFYYCNIDVDPTNPDKIYVNSTSYHVSNDRGKTWRTQSTPHGDNHDMWINPENPDLYIQGNDGGVNVTRDGGITWSTQNNQPTAELYQVDIDNQFPYWVYAGQQDNTTIAVPSRITYSMPGGPEAYWLAVGGCETGPAVPKTDDHNIVYSNCKGRFYRYSKLTGQAKSYNVGAQNMYGHNPADLIYRFQRVSPIIVSPHDPGIVYHASQYLHKTTDEGVTWQTISPDLTAFEPDKQVISGSPITRDITGEEFYSTLYSIAESKLVRGLIWTGANDGPVFVTRDGGITWKNVTPKELPSGGRVQTVEPSPHNPAKAYIAVYRYLLNDWQPYLFMTTNYGESWTRITTGNNGIPADEPVRVVREDPDSEGLLYAGTESGVYVSFDDGGNWQSLQMNLPVVPVTDIKVYRNDLVLSTMGRSFWIMDNITPLHKIKDGDLKEEIFLFPTADAYRMSRGPGATIDFYLPGGTASFNFTITDSKEEVVAKWLYGNPIAREEVSLENWKEYAVRRRVSETSYKTGMNRFSWDLRTYGATSAQGSSGSGPQVVPGTYRVTLDMGDRKQTGEFKVLPDPRIIADGVTLADMQEQYELSCQLRDFVVEARMFQSDIQKSMNVWTERLATGKRLTGREKGSYEKFMVLYRKVITETGIAYPQPMLIDQISYLNSQLGSADQKPGKDLYIRYEQLKGELIQAKKEFHSMK
jgi:photosystem II stability/assembly factor-like uncharacterized protein